MENLTDGQKEILRAAEKGLSKDYSWVIDGLKEQFPEVFKKKKIIVEIKYHSLENEPDLTNYNINYILNTRGAKMLDGRNTDVTELTEVYTSEDMIEFAEYYDRDDVNVYDYKACFEQWKQNRKTK